MIGVVELAAAHRCGARSVLATVEEVLSAVAESPPGVWIAVADASSLRARAASLEAGPRDLPLLGVPFAVKDNIDVAGFPTTAACPEFAYRPAASAFVVQRLLDAGAICVGKTNLDQFATGLVGTRSPYGAPSSVFAVDRVSGGSSSGSAVACASGAVAFALGTDTAGSGRVPAAFNGLVGLKPTVGRLSTRGVVPACRTLDCVSVFARDAADAAVVLSVADAYDPADPFSRAAVPGTAASSPRAAGAAVPGTAARPRVLGVPDATSLAALADDLVRDAWRSAVARAAMLADAVVEVDLAPFLSAARLLYEGPWVAERYAAAGATLERDDVTADPTVRAIVLAGKHGTAVDAFEGQYRLAELKRQTAPVWDQVDALLLPTVPDHPTHAEVAADPVGVNALLGTYTNFVNLLDLSAVAFPSGPRADGLPFGVTLVAPAWRDAALLAFAAAHEQLRTVDAAVVGAHLRGLPRHHELLDAGAHLVAETRTAPRYRLFDLRDGTGRPGLVQDDDGAAIAVEVWRLPVAAYGAFVAGIGSPLGIGTIALEDGAAVQGFLCEAHAVRDAEDVTSFGGWRAYRSAALA